MRFAPSFVVVTFFSTNDNCFILGVVWEYTCNHVLLQTGMSHFQTGRHICKCFHISLLLYYSFFSLACTCIHRYLLILILLFHASGVFLWISCSVSEHICSQAIEALDPNHRCVEYWNHRCMVPVTLDANKYPWTLSSCTESRKDKRN